jgi:ribosomal protein L11 methyltransferase
MNTYFRVLLSQIPVDQEDLISNFCFENGAAGISENLAFIQPDLTFDPILLPKDSLQLDIYFEKPPTENFRADLLKSWPLTEIKILEEPNKDWLEEWKKGLTSFALARDYWVIPSWLKAPPEARVPIYIDPGMAFGTGTHATTQLAARAIFDAYESRIKQDLPTQALLDVGTGTAILAMVGAHLGFSKVVGNDIDPIARDVARENLKHNHLSKVKITDDDLSQIAETFDVVVANIIDGVLIHLRSDLLRVSKPFGHLVLSGILQSREEHFTTKFFGSDLKILTRHTQDEWVSFLVQRTH